MNLSIYLIYTACLFSGSLLGILFVRKNFILLLLNIELAMLAVSTNFIIFSKLWNDIHGQAFVLFVLVISAVKIAISLVILLQLFKNNNGIQICDLSNLRN